MPWQLLNIFHDLPVFALVMFRLTGLMISAPLLASSMIPIRIRVGLTVAVALLVVPLVRPQAPAGLDLTRAVAGGVTEIMIGVTVGLGLALLVAGVEAAGLLLGQQSAVALGEVVNPTLEEQSSFAAQVYGIAFLILFLLAGGHRAAIAAVLDSFEAIPLLSAGIQESFVLLLIESLTASLVLGIRLGGPVLMALFLTETAMAIVSRTIPQLNILTIGFSLRVMLAHGVAAIALAASTQPLLDHLWETLDRIRLGLGLAPADIGLVN